MAYPSSVATRTVRASMPRDVTWQPRSGVITLQPLFPEATDTVEGDLVLPTTIALTLTPGQPEPTAEVIASDSPGLTASGFDWQVTWIVDQYSKTMRTRIPRWTGAPVAAPVLDLGLLAPAATSSGGTVLVPFVTPDQLAQALANVAAGARVHQQTTPATSWTIAHGFGRPAGVAVILDGEQQYPDVVSTAINVVVTFPTARTGTAVLT